MYQMLFQYVTVGSILFVFAFIVFIDLLFEFYVWGFKSTVDQFFCIFRASILGLVVSSVILFVLFCLLYIIVYVYGNFSEGAVLFSVPSEEFQLLFVSLFVVVTFYLLSVVSVSLHTKVIVQFVEREPRVFSMGDVSKWVYVIDPKFYYWLRDKNEYRYYMVAVTPTDGVVCIGFDLPSAKTKASGLSGFECEVCGGSSTPIRDDVLLYKTRRRDIIRSPNVTYDICDECATEYIEVAALNSDTSIQKEFVSQTI